MQHLFSQLWNDDEGIVALEYLVLATILGLGLVVGVSNLSVALNVEFSELANAILAFDQGNLVNNQVGCGGSKTGWMISDNQSNVTYADSIPSPSNNVDTGVVITCFGTVP